MGKKRGAVARAKKRGDVLADELINQTALDLDASQYEAKSDTELFVLDTTAAPPAKRQKSTNTKINDVEKKKKKFDSSNEIDKITNRIKNNNQKEGKKHRISDKDERQIKKLLTNHEAVGVVELAKVSRGRVNQAKKAKRLPGTAKTTFDLWESTGNDKNKNKTIVVTSGQAAPAGTSPVSLIDVSSHKGAGKITQSAVLAPKTQTQQAKVTLPPSRKLQKYQNAYAISDPKTIPVEVAQSGQSYCPDEEQHQDVIGEALGIELKRREALAYRNAPLGTGLTEETKKVLVGSSDEESSDDDDEMDEEAPVIGKRKEKLTRAQRNKQKRARALAKEIKEKKRVKQLLASVNDAKSLAKNIRKDEAEKIKRKEEIKQLKEEKRSKPLGVDIVGKLSELDPINAPSLPVALTQELKEHGGTLRSVRPKGSLLTDRVESMITRKLANRKNTVSKFIVQGKKKKMKGGKGREYLLI